VFGQTLGFVANKSDRNGSDDTRGRKWRRAIGQAVHRYFGNACSGPGFGHRTGTSEIRRYGGWSGKPALRRSIGIAINLGLAIRAASSAAPRGEGGRLPYPHDRSPAVQDTQRQWRPLWLH